MSLNSGQRLGPYEIIAPLGSGGMGEVYRARDTRLHRDVALKVLPPEVANDLERRRRFEHEAQAAARLEHHNVATVYDVGVDQQTPFIVSELISGTTLRALLGGQPLPTAKIVAVGAQVAEALGAAHEQSIVHRDIKPENILVTADGVVKVVDFGIAKLSDAASDAFATNLATQPGLVVGTPSYMSPEQIQGGLVDQRSDLFSLGCVLFEMATGRRPFDAKTPTETMAAVLRDEIAASEALAGIAPALTAILLRCLEKQPSRRFQSARDLAFALRQVTTTPLLAPPPAAKHVSRSTYLAWTVAAGALIVAAALSVRGRDPGSTGIVQGEVRQLTFDSGIEGFPNLSKDGSLIVYAGSSGGDRDIFLRDVDGRAALNLTPDSSANDSQPALSPDGQQIAFRSERDGGGIFVVSRTGGVARRVTRSGFNPTWSPDGKQIATGSESVDWRPESRSSDQATINVHNVASGESRPLKTSDAVQPAWSPNGQRIAYWGLGESRFQRDIWTVALAGGDPVPVTSDAPLDWDPTWSPDGRWLYFSSNRGGTMNLWRVAIDESTGKTRGEPESVSVPASWAGHARLGGSGEIVFASFLRVSNLDRVPFDPERARFAGQPEPLTTGSNDLNAPQPSKDSRALAFLAANGLGRNVFVSDIDGKNIRSVTSGPFRESGVQWHPNNQRVAFYSSRTGRYEIFAVNVDGSELQQLTDFPGYGFGRVVWSNDGRRIATLEAVTNRAMVLDVSGKLPVATADMLPQLPDGSHLRPTAWSFDNTRLLGETTAGKVAVFFFRDRTFKLLAERGNGGPRWLPDGRRILNSTNSEFYTVDESTGAIEVIGTSEPEATAIDARPALSWSLSWDGKWVYRSRFLTEADLWLRTAP